MNENIGMTSPSKEKDNNSIKVLSYNLRMDNPDDPHVWAERKAVAFNLIREVNPDLIGLQEAQEHMFKDVKEEFEESYYIFGEPRSLEEGTEATPVLAKKDRFNVLYEHSFMLSETPDVKYSRGWDGDLERIASFFILEDKVDMQAFVFFNTHFDHAGVEARVNSSFLMSQIIESYHFQGLESILTGDFNATPDLDDIKGLLDNPELNNSFDSMTSEEQENSLSFHVYKGEVEGMPIDHIFVSKPWSLRNVKLERFSENGIYPSDHYPISAEVHKG